MKRSSQIGSPPVSAASLPSGIDAAKIADGSVSNAEFQRLDGVSSNIQTQLNARLVAANNLSDVADAATARTNLGITPGITNSAGAGNSPIADEDGNLVTGPLGYDGSTLQATADTINFTVGDFLVNDTAVVLNGTNLTLGTGGDSVVVNGTSHFVSITTADFRLSSTQDASATPTINTPLGIVRIAEAGSAVTVTSAGVTGNSIIHAIPRTVDTTLKSVVVAPGSGSFVITGNAVATGNVDISIMIFNPA